MLLSRKLENILNQTENGKLPFTMRALIDPNRTGALIGRGGIIHKQIEDMFEVRMTFHEASDPIGRLASVYGHPTQVAQVWRDILLRMHGMKQFELNNEKNLGLDFLIPKPLADYLGRDEVFSRIQSASKANIRLNQYPLPDTNEHILQVTVSNLYQDCLNDFEMAVRILGQYFQDHVDLALSPFNVYYVPSRSKLPLKGEVNYGHSPAAAGYSLNELTEEDERWHEQLLAE